MNLDFKDRIRPFIEAADDPDKIEQIQNTLREDGVKSLLVVPILFEHLGFNRLEHYKFEEPKANAHSFADILVKDVFLFELKKFGLLNDSRERAAAEKQIQDYLKNQKDNINYGILTDGITWSFYLDKKYIEKHGYEEKDIAEIDSSVPMCFTLRISDENFLLFLTMFHCDCFEENIKKTLCRAIVNKTLNVPGRVALTPMFAKIENTQIASTCETILYEQIQANFRIDKGEFYQEIVSKSRKTGDVLFFEDDLIYIEGKLAKNGYIQVLPGKSRMKENQQEAAKRYRNLLKLLFSDWPNIDETTIYPDRKSVIKSLLDQKKLVGEEQWLVKWRFK